MKPDHKIVKTEDPEPLEPCKIVSRPSGNCPYFLVCLPQSTIDEEGLSADVVDDTAAFYEDYDLSEGEEDPMTDA